MNAGDLEKEVSVPMLQPFFRWEKFQEVAESLPFEALQGSATHTRLGNGQKLMISKVDDFQLRAC